ncbi:hypothetical protein AC477_05080 [miscellaneous Crenarchaeota group-1 archaeon SG8-32-1]|uniref:Uncharacterized protein n=1 Tax=miscellaneous Crenarchaeota group-1 archaeon SG8-32-1 TaxID=1685124 RepID=A0A0M0BNW5_9ARCH|nr:MAG: hypothetical protein AC477_05080 [miscellaneous Crenarchaeota group-1 archaeon SG8-32-1]
MTENVEPVNRYSPFLLVAILIAFTLSISALYIAVDSIINQTDLTSSYSFLAIGFFGLAITAYILIQTRKRPVPASFKTPKVLTTLECPKCDFKNIRDFERGDYIFKEAGPCQKCDQKMTITAIYREEKKEQNK